MTIVLSTVCAAVVVPVTQCGARGGSGGPVDCGGGHAQADAAEQAEQRHHPKAEVLTHAVAQVPSVGQVEAEDGVAR
ncbi:hypothetical protein [Nocardioides bigeumensis]|uniref:hypothetical protein n=1 Tax=Nocardioides bigeumensis TaxID=433657 RepID=UPI0031E21267